MSRSGWGFITCWGQRATLVLEIWGQHSGSCLIKHGTPTNQCLLSLVKGVAPKKGTTPRFPLKWEPESKQKPCIGLRELGRRPVARFGDDISSLTDVGVASFDKPVAQVATSKLQKLGERALAAVLSGTLRGSVPRCRGFCLPDALACSC